MAKALALNEFLGELHMDGNALTAAGVSALAAAGMLTYARVCSRMLAYAHVCSRMLTYAHVCSRMLTYAGVCSRMLTSADE